MEILVNPNSAYVLLVLGTVTLLMALVTPGTHLLEGGALLLLGLAGYEIFLLGFNVWAMVVLVLSLIPFIYAVYARQRAGRDWALGISIVAMVVGSLYLFPGSGLVPAVHPVVAVLVSVTSAGFVWFATRKGIQAHRARPLQDLGNLIGQTGQAKTVVSGSGSVQVAGELWSARSEKDIPAGSHVRVLSRDGFTLIVERDDQHK